MQRGIDILLSIKMEKTKSVETNQVGQYKYRKQKPQIKFKQKEHAMGKETKYQTLEIFTLIFFIGSWCFFLMLF